MIQVSHLFFTSIAGTLTEVLLVRQIFGNKLLQQIFNP